MKKWVKKTVKVSTIAIVSIVGLVVVIGSIALYLVLTPQRLTPIVEQLAAEYIDAKLEFDEVELTVISTFPRIGVRLKDAVLRSNTNDSLAMSDTIAYIKSAVVVFNPVKMIFDKNIAINTIKLDSPYVYTYIDTLGRMNWDIFKTDTTASDSSKFSMTMNLDKFELNNAKVVFDDRQSEIFGRIQNVNADIKGSFDKSSKIKAGITLDRVLLWQRGEVLESGLDVEIKVDAHNDAGKKQLIISDMCVVLNGLDIDVSGWARRDSVMLNASVQTDDINKILQLIPKRYISVKQKIDTKGVFKVDIDAIGAIGKKILPPLNVRFSIVDCGFKYDGFEYGIDDLDTKITAYIDLTRKTKSYVNVDTFSMSGTSLNMVFSGKIDDALGNNPIFAARTDIDIDFNTLSKTLPYSDSVDISGSFCFNGTIKSTLNDVRNIKWQNIALTGKIEMTNLELTNNNIEFHFKNNLSVVNLENLTNGNMNVYGHVGTVRISKSNVYDTRLKSADISLEVVRKKDSITSAYGTLGYSGIYFALPKDSIFLTSSASNMKVGIDDRISFKFKTDTLAVGLKRSYAVLNSANIDASILRKKWTGLDGHVQFQGIDIDTYYFPLAIRVESTTLSLNKDVIDLSKVDMRVGKSQFIISGSASGLLKSYKNKDEIIKLKGIMQSKNLDLNELIYASSTLFDYGSDTSQIAEVIDTTSGYPIFFLPKKLEANLTVNVDTLKFMDLVLTNTKGGVTMDQDKFRVRRILSHYMGSPISFRGLYSSNEADSSVNVTFAFDAKDIDVKKVTQLFPYLDSLTPIIRSVDGVVDLDLVAKSDFQNKLNVDMAKLDASIMVTAQKVEIPENETLTSVAKLLMFKNKQVTKVDSVSLQMNVGKGVVDIYPFIMDVDRYRVALGGTQLLEGNMDMDYHVSVLKSPVPIKFGINIKGNFEDFSVGIGKTQFKYLLQDKYKGYINDDYKNKRDTLFSPLVIKRNRK